MLHNLIKHQQLDIDKIYLKFISVKDPFESKYQLLINKTQVEIKKPKVPKAFIDYSQTNDDAY